MILENIEFTIPGVPVAKGRPKFARRKMKTKFGKEIDFVTTYTPEKTINYETLVQTCYTQSVDRHVPHEGPVHLKVMAYFPIPKSWTKKQKLQAEVIKNIPHLKRPDADNLGKIICDGLNNICWKDDSQVYAMEIYKYYSDTPRTDVYITFLD